MLDGLEIAVIDFKGLNSDLRLDAEYFNKKWLDILSAVKSRKIVSIDDIAVVTDGIHSSIDYDDTSNIRLFSATTPRKNHFNFSRNVFISGKQHLSNSRTALREKDIILSTVGTIGNCAVVTREMLPANADRHVAIIRMRCNFSPYLLSTFLLSKYGQGQMLRNVTGNVQPNLFLYKIREIAVPDFCVLFQELVQNFIKTSQTLERQAEFCYKQAEELLNKELNITIIENTKPFSIRSFAASFGTSSRLDAEYYQQKYEDLVRQLKTEENVKSFCKVHDANFQPADNAEYLYIELSNVGNNGDISGVTPCLGKDLPTRARRLVKKGQVIVSSIEGSLQSSALITEEFDGALCSTGFYVVDSARLNPETLLILFKSEAIQLLLKQRCSGTILTAISKNEFEKMPLPFVDDHAQQEIARLVQESFFLRKKSNACIEKAIKAVEIAIEQDENAAIRYLKEV